MGFDISNHAVDVVFIRERLIPYILGRGDALDDYLDRAAKLSVVSHRANRWGLRTVKLDRAIHDAQRRNARPGKVMRKQRTPPPKPLAWWERLIGKRPPPPPAEAYEEVEEWVRTTGVPGFESDLSVWGRPFFVVADDADDALREFEGYLHCAPQEVDAIAQRMLGKLEARRGALGSDVRPEIVATLDGFYPLLTHLSALDERDGAVLDHASVRANLERRLRLTKTLWALRKSKKSFEDEALSEPVVPSEYVESLPFDVINLAAQTLPGWMGRGHVWPTALFDKIGVDVDHLFETPESLFRDLVAEHPALRRNFGSTIESNYSLGGYVPPEKMDAFVALLERHRVELIMAWNESEDPANIDEALAADYLKILEPAMYAQRNGFGFLEAAEVYSGFMGAMN